MIDEAGYKIAVIGAWHLAFVTAACLAEAGHKTILVNPEGNWTEFPQSPVAEPGLNEMIQRALSSKRLGYCNGINKMPAVPLVWLAMDTPVNEKDEPQIEELLQAAREVNAKLPNLEVFALSSQVPLGFGLELEKIIGKKVAYIPENLRLGQGIETFSRADRTVIGASSEAAGETIRALLKTFKTEFLMCDLPTAEMVKHANNAFLATSISFANEMARIGSNFGVDNYLVAKALKLDARIGPKAYVSPGLGFAGGTLPRDLRVLEKIGKQAGIPTPLVSAVLTVNQNTAEQVAHVVLQKLAGAKNPRALILGYTYKADTDTLRRSLSVDVAQVLTSKGVECHGFDPVMNGKDLSGLRNCIAHHDDLAGVPGCEVILLMTARPHFRDLEWSKLVTGPRPQLVIDTHGFLDAAAIRNAGLDHRLLWGTN